MRDFLTFLETGVGLRPRVVFVCTHPTDLEEVVRHYGATELARFVSAPAQETGAWPHVEPEFRPRPAWDPVAFWSLHVALPMESSGVLGAVVRGLRGKGHVVVARRDPFVPTTAEQAMGLDGLVPPGLADPTLPWRLKDSAYNQAFPQGKGTLAVVVEAASPAQTARAATMLARALEHRPEVFTSVSSRNWRASDERARADLPNAMRPDVPRPSRCAGAAAARAGSLARTS